MKTVRGWLIVAITLLAQCWATAQPVAQWDDIEHDFGSFLENQGRQTCAFKVTNTGNEPLVLLQVKSTCGCTVAQHPTQAIMPGKTDSVSVTFIPTGRPGPFKKSVWVHTNANSAAKTQLTIKGVVVGSPESVKQHFPVNTGDLNFTKLTMMTGEVKKGIIRNSTTTAYNSGNDTLVISFDNNTSHINPRAVPDTVAPGGISTMSFFFDTMSTPLWGINDDEVTIIATPLHSEHKPIKATANIVANVVEDFSNLTNDQLANAPVCGIITDKIVMDDINPSQPALTTLTFKNTGKSDLVIRRVMSLDKAITASCDKTLLKPGKEATLTIKVNPAKVSNKILNTQFTVITNDPINPCTTVRIVGEIK